MKNSIYNVALVLYFFDLKQGSSYLNLLAWSNYLFDNFYGKT